MSKERELEIGFTGRSSGRSHRTPVWFVYENDRIYLLPVKGSDTGWYRNIRANNTMSVSVSGKNITVSARPTSDPSALKRVIERFNRKYGEEEIKKWYSKLDVSVELPLPR